MKKFKIELDDVIITIEPKTTDQQLVDRLVDAGKEVIDLLMPDLLSASDKKKDPIVDKDWESKEPVLPGVTKPDTSAIKSKPKATVKVGEKKICKHCGKEYKPTSNRQNYCSPACSKAYHKQQN